jgi:hypothetical protein
MRSSKHINEIKFLLKRKKKKEGQKLHLAIIAHEKRIETRRGHKNPIGVRERKAFH